MHAKQVADLFVYRRDRSDTRDLLFFNDRRAHRLDTTHHCLGRQFQPALHQYRICTRRDVLQAFLDYRLCQHSRRGY